MDGESTALGVPPPDWTQELRLGHAVRGRRRICAQSVGVSLPQGGPEPDPTIKPSGRPRSSTPGRLSMHSSLDSKPPGEGKKPGWRYSP